MLDARMIKGFVNRLVSVSMFCVFSDHRDADLMLGIAKGEHHVVPRVQSKRLAGQMQTLHHEFIEFVVPQRKRDFINGKVFVQFLDDRFQGDVAEQRNLFAFFARDALFASANQHVRLDPDLTQ